MSNSQFKVVVLGEGRVGKTSLLIRYVENGFTESQQSTIQASYLEKRLNIGSDSVCLMIWDTAGQEKYHSLAPIYYRDADGAILVYDITDETSFNKVQNWAAELKKLAKQDIRIVIAANKQDLSTNEQVSKEEARSYASQVSAKLIGTSAKTGVGVQELFLELTKLMLVQAKSQQETTKAQTGSRRQNPKIKIEDAPVTSSTKSKACCVVI